MPIYCFQCSGNGCNHAFELVLPMKDCMKKQACPECGKKAFRDVVAEHSDGTVDSQMREYEFYGDTGTRMYAASYLPHQLSEAKRKHPDRQFRLVNGAYLPVIKHRRDKLQYLKEFDPSYIEY